MVNLKIGSHNINGGGKAKLSHVDLVDRISQFDIYCIQECWLEHNDDCINVPGYKYYRSLRKKGKNKRVYGGCLLFFKQELDNRCIKKMVSSYEDFLWVWIDGSKFDTAKDIYLCCVYIPHEGSKIHGERNVDPFSILAEETAHYQTLGDIIYLGDCNSRTGQNQEDWSHVDNIMLPVFHNEIDSGTINIPPKMNRDEGTNRFGSKLTKLCETLGLVILNGRTTGDYEGKLTYIGTQGTSTIDYAICSLNLFKYVKHFFVEDMAWYSDHCAISLILKSKATQDWSDNIHTRNKPEPETHPHKKYMWTEESKLSFTHKMHEQIIQSRIASLSKELDEDPDIEIVTGMLTNVIQDVADSTCKLKTIGEKHGKKEQEVPPCYTEKLKWAKTNFLNSWQYLKQNPGDINRRMTLIKCRRKFKRLKYLIERYKKEDKIKKIAELQKKDTKAFWAGIRKLRKGKPKPPDIKSNQWTSYFTRLLNLECPNINKSFSEFVHSSLPYLETKVDKNDTQLNNPITISELENELKSLKNNKAAGPDRILNEMIKAAGKNVYQVLVKLYNTIFSKGQHPASWKKSIITPIFKSGDPNTPSNYRGIAVSNTMHKLYTKILNTRIMNFMSEQEKWSPNQNGFMKGKRTEDNIFILESVFNKYVRNENKQAYIAYVDFQKIFDTISREHLMYKLLKNNITGEIYYAIKNMYCNTSYCVKTPAGLSNYFLSNSGVLQGCNLSPTLSNIFQNDLHHTFGCDSFPIDLNGEKLNSLSWADDLVLMSTTREGLQNCLDKLQGYCNKWGLTINVQKTKTMVFRKGLPKIKQKAFTIGEIELEEVKKYKYLGVVISYNGKHQDAINDRIDKATKCIYSIKNAVSNNMQNISTSLALTLFQKQVSPILLYGCPSWALPEANRRVRFTFHKLNYFAKSQVSTIMQDILQQEVDITRHEIIRNDKQVVVELASWRDKCNLLNKYNMKPGPMLYKVEDDIHVRPQTTLGITKVQTKFCKFTLGLSKFASSTAVLRELGQYPIELQAIRHSLMYYYRLCNEISGTSHKLLQNAFECMKATNHPWLENVAYAFSKNGLNSVHLHINQLRKSYVKSSIKQRLEDQYKQQNEGELSKRAHLNSIHRTDFSSKYEMKPYLGLIKTPSIRCIFTRIRLNCTMLSPNPYSEIVQNCPLCKKLRDWEHCLIECPNNNAKFEQYIMKIEKYIPMFGRLGQREQFHRIINLVFPPLDKCSREAVLSITLAFVYNTYKSLQVGECSDHNG